MKIKKVLAILLLGITIQTIFTSYSVSAETISESVVSVDSFSSDKKLWNTTIADTSNYGKPYLYQSNNSIYLASTTKENDIPKVIVRKWNGSSFEMIGKELVDVSSPVIIMDNNILYLACVSNSNNVVYYKLEDDNFVKITEDETSYLNSLQLVAGNNTVYVMYKETLTNYSNKLIIKDIINGKKIFEKITNDNFQSSFTYSKNKLYFSYVNNGKESLECFDLNTNKVTEMKNISGTISDVSLVTVHDDKIYFLLGINNNLSLYIYDGKKLENLELGIGNFSLPIMNVINDEVYISYIDQTNNKTYLLKVVKNTSYIVDDTLGDDCNFISIANDKENMYVVSTDKTTTNINFKSKELSSFQNIGRFININGNIYYYLDGVMQKGIVEIAKEKYLFGVNTGKLYTNGLATTPDGNTYLTDEDGKLLYGFQIINNDKYYFDQNGVMIKGVYEIDKEKYLFGVNTGKLYTNGLATTPDGNTYLTDENGKLLYGFKIVNNDKYYFDKDGKMVKGIYEIDKEKYLFGVNTGKLYTNGLATTPDGNTYLTDENGKLLYGFKIINNDKYYFDQDGKMVKGVYEIDKEKYLFGVNTGKLYTDGLAATPDGSWYLTDFNGIIQVGEVIINNHPYLFNSDGKLNVHRQIPVYYSQKDNRWKNVTLGLSNIGSSGCAPTSLAMAYTTILNRTILPLDVANYLYYNTNEYNKKAVGASGMAVVYASDYFNVSAVPIKSKLELQVALASGRIVFAAMGNGKFATKTWNHAIILFDYNNGFTYAYDPLRFSNNGWFSLDQLLTEQSSDPDDSTGGSNFYVLKEKVGDKSEKN